MGRHPLLWWVLWVGLGLVAVAWLWNVLVAIFGGGR